MTGQTPTGSTLRAPPTGNPYAPPVTMMRPQQGYQPQNMPQQRQVDYAYRSQYVAPVQRPMPQWAMPQPYTPQEVVNTSNAEAAYAAQSGWNG